MEDLRTNWPGNLFSNRAVSFWRPVGDLLVNGIKTCENRLSGLNGLKTLPPQGIWIAVHNATKLMGQNKQGYEDWRNGALALNPAIPSYDQAKESPCGAIVGLVHFKSVAKYESDPSLKMNGWAKNGCFCFIVDDFVRFDKIILTKGFQGVWFVHDKGHLVVGSSCFFCFLY